MNTFLDISQKLSGYIKDRTSHLISISHLTADMEARKLAITPTEGWQGKNEAERKLAAERSFAGDDVTQAILGELVIKQDLLTFVDAEIAMLETERRAMEWTVRSVLADALAGRRENHADPADSAFDDAAQAQLDQVIPDEFQALEPDNIPDDLPF